MEKDFLPNRDNTKFPVSQITVDFVRGVYGGSTFNGLISLTGRGVQLWWCLTPVPAKQFSDYVSKISRFFIAVLKDFLDEFPSELSGFRVDATASSNLAEVYRLPGSVNPQRNKEVEAIRLHSNKLDLQGFWAHCLSASEIASSIQKSQNSFRYYGRATNFSHVAERRIEAICQLRDMRYAPAGEETRKMNCDFLIVDEASMIDIKLFGKLLKSIRRSTHVVFCGDPDQLACVGGGDVLRDMIISGKIPVAALSQIYRQTEGSSIIQLAHQIKTGNVRQSLDVAAFQADDLIFIESEDEDVIKSSVLDPAADLLAAGVNADDIQVLAATNDWCVTLNPQLRTILNPTAASGHTRNGYANGDRVPFLENDYTLKLHNGETGIVRAVSDRHLEIDCGGSIVKYRRKDLCRLSLAYAMTIHKAQGSEYPFVIIPIHKSMGRALTRKLVYTALTRAKKKCILLGSEETLLSALKRTDSRKSLLSKRLADLLP